MKTNPLSAFPSSACTKGHPEGCFTRLNQSLFTLHSSLFTIIILFCLPGCAINPRGMPVKEYQPAAAEAAQAAGGRGVEQSATIAALRPVTENQVFRQTEAGIEYIIGPGDVLELTLWEQTKPAKYDAVVRADGRISYSFLDDIMVTGLTPNQVDQLLTEQLSRYIRRVRLDVLVKEYNSKSALLFGQFNVLQTGGKSGQGKYVLKGRTPVLDLIVEAGGVSKDADLKKVELIRQGRRYLVNLYDTMFQGDISQNFIVDNGDIVTIPELEQFGERIYVFGQVKSEGIYPHKEAYDLLAALGRAGGCASAAVREDIKIIRGYAAGKPVVLSANLDAILKQGDIGQNLRLKDGDVVYVPRNFIGDVNEFIANTTPLLDFLFYPANYRDKYVDPARSLYLIK